MGRWSCQAVAVTEMLRVSEEVSAAAWIAPRFGGAFGAVTRTVPSGFQAYVRICHPVEDSDGGYTTWSRVAKATGRQPHALMQWHALVGSSDPLNFEGSLWPAYSPDLGNLVPEVLAPLCELLAGHTAGAERCFFCLWDGWAWVTRGAYALRSSPDPILPTFSAEELSRPRVRHPDRDYLLLEGPLTAALHLGDDVGAFRFGDPQSPNLFWPEDHAWCVASEIDYDSTLIGDTTELVHAIINDPTFDAWPVQPDDSLAADADLINQVPPPLPRRPLWP
jgi:hypothetical protein